ncbi:SH3 domain-containing protein [Planotetraspora thailandica]
MPTCTYQLTNLRAGGYVNVRTAPALNARPVAMLKTSDGRFTGTCTSSRGWVAVRSPTGSSGWISGHYLQKVSSPPRTAVPRRPSLACTYQLANVRRSSYLNVRTAPWVGARRVGSLRVSDGRLAGGCAPTHGWVAVKSSNGRSGWAFGHYLRKTTRSPLASATPAASRPWGCMYQLTRVRPTGTVTVYSSRSSSSQPVGTLSLTNGRFGGGCTATQSWIPVTSSNGRPGWAPAYYLQKVGG